MRALKSARFAVFNVQCRSVVMATRVKSTFASLVKSDNKPAFIGNVSISFAHTVGTRVRLSLMRSISKRQKERDPTAVCSVTAFTSRPLLRVGGKDQGTRFLSFVDAIAGFRHLLTQSDLDKALSLCTGQRGKLKSKFLVLSDDRVLPPYQGKKPRKDQPGQQAQQAPTGVTGPSVNAFGHQGSANQHGQYPLYSQPPPVTGSNMIPVTGQPVISGHPVQLVLRPPPHLMLPGLTQIGGALPSIGAVPSSVHLQSAQQVLPNLQPVQSQPVGLTQPSVVPPSAGQLQSFLPLASGAQYIPPNPAIGSPSLLQSTGQVTVTAEVHQSSAGPQPFVKVTRKRGRKAKPSTESKRSTPMRKVKEKSAAEVEAKPLPNAADVNKSANQEDFASCASSDGSDEDDIMVDPSVEEQ